MTTIIDKRNFCLMLSSQTGQEVAHQLGFAPPSKEVQELEKDLIEGQWDVLHHFGIFDEIVESVEWFSQVLERTAPSPVTQTPEMLESAKTVIMSYGMALVQKLLSNNKIVLIGTAGPLLGYDDDEVDLDNEED